MKTVQEMIREMHAVLKDEYKVAQELSTPEEPIGQPSVNRWKLGYNQRVSYARYIRITEAYKRICHATDSRMNTAGQSEKS